MKKELKPLYDSGWALLALKSGSKAPKGSGWTKGPRTPWEKIDFTGNIGVRLGKASKVNGGYLACLDCDVKGGPDARIEMQSALQDILKKPPGNLWEAASGRGSGSCHIYFLSKSPLKPKLLKRSPDVVKVLIPSVAPTPREKRELSREELTAGFRLRAAWEISLMGEGQQVVLPPSVHPDSGKRYRWLDRPNQHPGFLDLFDGALEQDRAPAPAHDFKVVPYDLIGSELSSETVKVVTDLEGVEDRSDALFRVIMEMKKAGWSKAEVVSCLTDPRNALSAVAYDHRKTKDRARAADWLYKYGGVRKVYDSAYNDFEADIVEGVVDEKAALTAASELVEPPGDWKIGIERAKNGRPLGNHRNLCLILSNLDGGSPIYHDTFADKLRWAYDTPWGTGKDNELKDADIVLVYDYLSHKYRIDINGTGRVFDALTALAYKTHRHPVREWLSTLEWDGKPRLDSWLKTYLGASGPEVYLRAVGRKVLIGMIARVMNPGCYFAHIMVLEGKQRVGKSSTVAILGKPWTTDTVLDIRNKDSMQTLQGIWVLEISELAQFSRGDTAHVKNFISSQVDRFRPPYGRVTQEYARQCIFIGTTNEREYLKDPTGNSRFWPVKFGEEKMNREKLIRDREQLLAEAVVGWELGEKLYLDTPELERIHAAITREREESDDMVEDAIEDFLSDKAPDFEFRIADIFDSAPDIFGVKKSDRPMEKRIGVVLRKMGFEKRRKREGKNLGVFWSKMGGQK